MDNVDYSRGKLVFFVSQMCCDYCTYSVFQMLCFLRVHGEMPSKYCLWCSLRTALCTSNANLIDVWTHKKTFYWCKKEQIALHNLKDNSMLNQVLSSEELDEIAETRQSRNLNFKAVFNKNNKKKKKERNLCILFFVLQRCQKCIFCKHIFCLLNGRKKLSQEACMITFYTKAVVLSAWKTRYPVTLYLREPSFTWYQEFDLNWQ